MAATLLRGLLALASPAQLLGRAFPVRFPLGPVVRLNIATVPRVDMIGFHGVTTG
jgi:hypothetical protein